jgi:hypothetical protein
MDGETALRYRDGMANELADCRKMLGNLRGERDGLIEKIEAEEARESELVSLLKHLGGTPS